MKAIINDQYGPIEKLEQRDIAMPVCGDDEVLIRVQAAGLHVGDVFKVRGSPFPMRLATGLRRPSYGVPGFDLAGRVESVGKNVTRFKVGDEVFGSANGTCAEYSRAAERDVVAKPSGISFQEAASIPTSALAALHGLRDAGKLRAGQRVLINGASGGVGSFAVQIAKALGADVTGVCSTRNVELVRRLGADRVIDYTREDFTSAGPKYDLIFDNIENRRVSDLRRALTPTGTLVLNSGTGAEGMRLLARLVGPLIRYAFSAQKVRRFVSAPKQSDLTLLAELAAKGTLRPAIDSVYGFADAPAALRHIATGHARGKVVVAIA